MMRYLPRISLVVAMSVAGVLPFLAARNADAVPAFARQTGRSCMDCHTVFPELTPFGRAFKLGGYTLSQENRPPVPIAAMVQASFTSQKSLQTRIDPYDNSPVAQFNVPEAASLFYAGKIIDHVGAFAQLTYSGVGNNLFLDNTDVRYANFVDIGDTRLLYGFTANNNPTMQDVWNTTPAWGFPYATSAVAVTPAASPIVNTLAQQVGGIGAYGYWNDLVYGEVSVYRTTRNGITRPLAAGTTIVTDTDGVVPYWRLVLQKQLGPHSLSVGTFGMVADVFPAGALTTGPTDRFTDTALDGQYQYIGKQNIFTLQSVFIHENQNRSASFALGNTSNPTDFLNTFRANANYYRRSGIGTLGGTFGYFQTTGRSDSVLYAPADTVGSRTGQPDSRGYIIEADYLPLDKLKLSLQYTVYNKFNGAHTDYDGSGRNASDNNTLFLVAWIAF